MPLFWRTSSVSRAVGVLIRLPATRTQAFRSFDSHWLIPGRRFCDQFRRIHDFRSLQAALWRFQPDRQTVQVTSTKIAARQVVERTPASGLFSMRFDRGCSTMGLFAGT